MIKRLRILPSHRRMMLMIWGLNVAFLLALMAFGLRGYGGDPPPPVFPVKVH